MQMTKNDMPSTAPITIMGILLFVLGIFAVATPAVAGEAVVILIGIAMLLAGIVQLVSGLRTEGWYRKLPPLVLGAIALICAAGLLGEPWFGLEFITLILAIFFAVEGTWKIVTAFNYRPARGWLAFLASGILTLVLGLLIWRQWPMSGLWAVGILVGINFIITGISLVVVAATIRQLKSLAREA